MHNVNRKEPNNKDESLPKKMRKKENMLKHAYPEIPPFSEDDESNERNLTLLKEEGLKTKPSKERMKTLMTCTFPY